MLYYIYNFKININNMAIALKDIYIFEWIEKNLIEKIVDNSRRTTFERWEYIIKEWEKSNWFAYIIQSWKVEVEKDNQKIAIINEGNIFWEIALITNESRTASIKAITPLTLLQINKELLKSIIKDFKNWKDIQIKLFERIMENLLNENELFPLKFSDK